MSTRKTVEKKTKKETSKDDKPIAKKLEEKPKKSIYSVSTPRAFVQKSSAADIYAGKNTAVQSGKTPKKHSLPPNARSNILPTKDLLKSSPSSVSQISTRSNKSTVSTKASKAVPSSARLKEKPTFSPGSARNVGVEKKLSSTNVTVNSPIAKIRLLSDDVTERNKEGVREEELRRDKRSKETKEEKIVFPARKRTKTRTLDDEEIKILTPDVVDNNPEILNLTKLNAQPKAFYIDLNENKDTKLQKAKSSDEEVSYEDDFESYESDFESYHSASQSDQSSLNRDDYESNDINDLDDGNDVIEDEEHSKEEKMLDSGNFELRDPRTVCKAKPMEFIVEDTKEVDKKVSLTDEGFQEMSSSSGLSSMKTLHVDILERPLFIDFTKSRESRKKRKILEKLRQRADDILSMVTLHEMSYSLVEMKPIPYDLYMATFGKCNYTQTGIQTYDDGITEEIQTDEILTVNKWTQHPIEFSNNIFEETDIKRKNGSVGNFAFLFNNENDNNNNMDEDYKNNPLRVYLEQKDGVGSSILPHEIYKSRLKNDDYNVTKLGKFLKKYESRISNILTTNTGNTISNLIKTSKFPFSNEYLLISTRDMTDKFSFLKCSQIIGTVFSDTNSSLFLTVHNKASSSFVDKKCVLCLWDTSIANLEPLKILVATDDVRIGRFRGSTDGFIIAGLYDGSIHLWDLAEEPTWCHDIASEENSTKIVENTSDHREDSYNRNRINKTMVSELFLKSVEST